jgi:hypothetical protein
MVGDRGRLRFDTDELISLLFDDVKQIFSYSLELNGIISSSSSSSSLIREKVFEC